jgi:hypothetical protein
MLKLLPDEMIIIDERDRITYKDVKTGKRICNF